MTLNLDFIGLEMLQLHWHYWLGIGTVLLLNVMILTNRDWHHNKPFLYFIIPVVFSVLVYFAFGIVSFYAGWF